MRKRLLLLLCLLVTAGSAAWADIANGSCKNGSWVIDNSGKLTVNINGNMADYGEGKAPWYGYAEQITAIHIGSGCKNVGRNGFYGLYNVGSVTGGENVESVAMYAFEACGGGEVKLSAGANYYGGEKNIPLIYFPKCSYVGECAFAGCAVEAISLPLVETWKVSAISGSRSTYGVSQKNMGYGLLNVCDIVDLGSKTKMLRPGSLMGPSYVFCQNPTPPEWERLYAKDEGQFALSYVVEGLWDLVTGVGGWIWGHENIGDMRERDYEYPFGDNGSVMFIVPPQYLQTYIDYYPSKHDEVASGFMCAAYTDADDHSKKGKTISTGKLVAGAPIYENGKLIGGWYYREHFGLYVFYTSEMPSYEGKAAPWTSFIKEKNSPSMHMFLEVGSYKIPANAFKGGQALQGINYIELDNYDDITIGDNAFQGCTDLHYVVKEDKSDKGALILGNSAFKDCSELYCVNLDIKSLGESTFEGCKKLGGVQYEVRLACNQVPDYAFKDCGVLKRIDISKVRFIGKRAFYNCPALNEIDLSNCVSVGEEAFAKNSESVISSINFGPSTQSAQFGSKCFGNTKPGDIFVSSVLTSDIPSDAFAGVTLSDIKLHCKPELYGDSYEHHPLFGQMKVDKVFAFPVEGSIINAPSGSIWSLSSAGTLKISCNKLPDYDSNEKQPWYQYREFVKDLILENCTKIGTNNFTGLESLRNVSIPRDCKEIRDNAFKGCTSLENIYITRVEKLGNNVFEGCTSLESIELGMHLTSVGDYIFKDCHSLIDIENLNSTPATTTSLSFAGIKSSVYNLRGGPRKANDGQSTVTLNVPDAYVTTYMLDENWSQFHITYADERGTWVKAGRFGDGKWILYDDGTMLISANMNRSSDDEYTLGFWKKSGDQSNSPCMLTKKIEFAGDLTEVGPYFYDFKNLEGVTLCPSIKNIKKNAFSGCEKLRRINLDNVDVIEGGAFNNTGFDVIDLSSVKEIGNGAFSHCENLGAAKLGPDCKLGSSAFSGCSVLTAIDLSGADLEKASQCFANCTSLTFAAVKGTRLSGGIFANCTGLKAINLGSKMESIEYDAFDNCNNLDTIYIDRPTPPALPKGERLVQHGDVDYEFVEAWPFDGLTLKNIHLVVPPDYIAAYKKANIWKDMTIEGDVAEEEPSLPMGGSLGTNATWYLDEAGTLTIDGEGDVVAFDKDGKPWCEKFNALAGLIKNVVVGNEITSLPSNFFGGDYFAETSAGIETVTLGEGLLQVGDNSLSFSGIKDVYIYSVMRLGLFNSTFNQDAAIKNDATLHCLQDAAFNKYLKHYQGYDPTKRFPHIVADLVGKDPKVETVSFNQLELTIYIGQSIDLNELNPQFIPANVKDKTLRFNNQLTSGNVTIDENGVMTGVFEGRAYIEAWSDYTADGTPCQALWGPDQSSTYLKVTVTEDPGPEPIFFDVAAYEATDAPWTTYHVLRDEHIDVDTDIKTCEVAGYYNEDDVTTQAIPEWQTGAVVLPEEARGYEVVRIGAYAFYERQIRALYIPWTVTEIGYNACAYCDYLTDVFVTSFQPLKFTDAYGDPMEESMGHNDAFYRIGEGDDGEGYATLHVPAGSRDAWNVYPWNEWFRFIVEDAEIPDGINETYGAYGANEAYGTYGDWFDLSGRKLGSKPTMPGLYIMNGRKVVVK